MEQTRVRENILGVYFDVVSMDQAVNKMLSFTECESPDVVYTPNPEIVMAAYDNKDLQDALNKGALVIPDGIGVVMGSRIIGGEIRERVAGYDLIQHVFDKLKLTNKTVYLYGAKPGVAKQAVEKMIRQYPGLTFVGYSDGYEKDQEAVIEQIASLKPDFLLVGLGAPRQEYFIEANRHRLGAKVIMGVGGSIDVMAGVVKRAPDFFVRLNIEWLFRLIKQPSRAKRMLQLPRFLIKMIVVGKNYQS